MSSDVQKVAKVLCRQCGCDPYALEPGDDPYGNNEPVVDGEAKGGPAFFMWRQFVPQAREILSALKAT